MSINSTQLFQSVGTLNSNGFLVISDANVASNEISANDITCLVVENEITNYDLSFSNTENVHAKTVVYSENTFIKPTTITTSYTGYNTSSEYQSLRIVDKNDELFIGSTNTSFKALVKSTNGTTWTDISSSLTSCEQVLICRDDDETYVAVGQGATPILYSYDGVYWVDASCNGLFTKVNGVAYGNGVYVAVGEGANTIAYSYDAVQWVGLGSSIFSSGGNSVIYANGVWVGCGGSSNTLAHSSDGINWTGLGNTIFTSNGNSLIYAKDTYVCLGEGTSDSVAYSSDGISWTGIGNSLLTSGFSVDYGNGRFIAGGQGNHTLIYSLDGVNWTAYTTSLFTTECRSVGYAGTTWYICGDTQGATVYISEDGIVWNLQSGIDFHLTSVDYRYLHSVRFPAKHMVAVGDDSSHTISWSSNGTTWNDVSGSGDMFLEGKVACYNGKYWIAGGSSIPSEDTSYNLAYSQDGKTWTGILSNVFDSSVQGLVFDQTHNLMIACGTGSINTLAYSYDYGITWIGLGKSIFSTNGNAVAHNGEMWVAVGSGKDNTIAYSTDGLNWIGLGKTIFSTSGNAITYNNNLWVATGEGTNAIARSSDGKTWTGVTNTSLVSGYSVAGHGSNWLAGGKSTNTDITKIRVRRITDHNYTPNENGITLLDVSKFQMWINGINVVTQGTIDLYPILISYITALSNRWEFRYITLNNSDSVTNTEAEMVNFSDSDASSESGLQFDGTSKYVDLSSNSITLGNMFSFETYLKSFHEENVFRKIRVRRVAEQVFTPRSSWINLIHIAEIQLWINGTNVALNGTVESSSALDSRYVDTNVIDNDITGFVDAIWHSDYYDGDYDFVSVVLSQNYDISNVESIVVYSPTHSSQEARDDMMKGCVIELLDGNNNIVVSTPTITVGNRYFRFDGPALANVSTFSSIPSTSAIIEPPTVITSSNQVSVISNMNLWTTRNFISADGQYMVVSTVGSYTEAPDDDRMYYSQDGGVTWQESTINDSVKTIGGIRNGSITANGQYSCFHDTHMNNGVYVYYSSDYCQTYNYAGKTNATYYGLGPFINEAGTIMILGSTGTKSPYHDLHIGYVNQTTLSATTWTILNVSGLNINFGVGFCGNADFTHILLGTSTGTFVFNNSDTSKLINASYWSRSSNSNVSNIVIREGYSSVDNSVIVLTNNTEYSQEIWFSTDYGSSFYNLYNSDLSEFSRYGPNVHVSPNGEYVAIWRSQQVCNIFIYSVGDNGTYSKLLTIPSSTFNGAPVAHVSISDVGKILVTNHTYGSHNLAAAWVLDIDMNNYQSWNITDNLPSVGTRNIFALGSDNSNKLELTTLDITNLTLTNAGISYDVSYNGSMTDFTHIVGTVDSSSMKLYMNNTLVDSIDVVPFDNNTTFTHNYLGSDLSNNNMFDGSIAYFKTWKDYALTTSDISTLYDERNTI